MDIAQLYIFPTTTIGLAMSESESKSRLMGSVYSCFSLSREASEHAAKEQEYINNAFGDQGLSPASEPLRT